MKDFLKNNCYLLIKIFVSLIILSFITSIFFIYQFKYIQDERDDYHYATLSLARYSIHGAYTRSEIILDNWNNYSKEKKIIQLGRVSEYLFLAENEFASLRYEDGNTYFLYILFRDYKFKINSIQNELQNKDMKENDEEELIDSLKITSNDLIYIYNNFDIEKVKDMDYQQVKDYWSNILIILQDKEVLDAYYKQCPEFRK